MYKEPLLDFRATKSMIKAYETRELLSETSTAISYRGENLKVTAVLYSMKNGIYKGSIVLIPYSSSNQNTLVNFISDRYSMTTNGSDIVFMSADRKIAGTIILDYYVEKYHYFVTYIDGSSIGSSYSANATKNFDEELKSIILENSKLVYSKMQ